MAWNCFMEPETQAYDGDAEAWQTWKVCMPPPLPPVRTKCKPAALSDDVAATFPDDDTQPTLVYEAKPAASGHKCEDDAQVPVEPSNTAVILTYRDEPQRCLVASQALNDAQCPVTLACGGAATHTYDAGAIHGEVRNAGPSELTPRTPKPRAEKVPPQVSPVSFEAVVNEYAAALPRDSKRPEPGDKVRIHGLLKTPKLNGSYGHVDKFIEERGRCMVIFESGEAGNLKLENLEVVASERSNTPEPPLVAGPPVDAAWQRDETCRRAAPQAQSRTVMSSPKAQRKNTVTSQSMALPSRCPMSVGMNRRRLRGKQQPPSDAWRYRTAASRRSTSLRLDLRAATRSFRAGARTRVRTSVRNWTEAPPHTEFVGTHVCVKGDGWGGGTGEHEAIVLEADELTFTVVFKSSATQHKETYVLRAHCIGEQMCEPRGSDRTAKKRRTI